MKKAVYLIVGGFMWASSIFGSAYTEADFEQIPSLVLHRFSEVRDFFEKSSVNVEGREWKYAFSYPRYRFDPISFLRGDTAGLSIRIKKFDVAAAREPFFTLEGRLYRVVSLEIAEKESEIERFSQDLPMVVSTYIDPKLSDNPLVELAEVNSIKEITDAAETKLGPVWECFSNLFFRINSDRK